MLSHLCVCLSLSSCLSFSCLSFLLKKSFASACCVWKGHFQHQSNPDQRFNPDKNIYAKTISCWPNPIEITFLWEPATSLERPAYLQEPQSSCWKIYQRFQKWKRSSKYKKSQREKYHQNPKYHKAVGFDQTLTTRKTFQKWSAFLLHPKSF